MPTEEWRKMNYSLDKWQEPVSAVPMTVTVNGEQYVLASAGQQRQGLMVPQDGALQHHLPRNTIQYNGEPHVLTPTGVQPYASQSSTIYPRWTRSAYTRGFGLFGAAAVMGVFILCLGIALHAVVTAVIANAFAIGMTLIAILMGGLVFLGALAKARHGYKPGRR
jgi:hypothetical protein